MNIGFVNFISKKFTKFFLKIKLAKSKLIIDFSIMNIGFVNFIFNKCNIVFIIKIIKK